MTSLQAAVNHYVTSSPDMEGAGSILCSATSHQGAIEVFWPHFWGDLMASICIYTVGLHAELQYNVVLQPQGMIMSVL